jgi:hypothetical protein
MCCATRNTLFSNSAMAAAGAFALRERGHRADRAEHAAHDVVHAGARAQRPPFRARHVREAAHHLHHFVERGAMLVRPRQEALVRHVHEARIQREERGIAEAEPVHRAALEVLAEDIRRRDEPQHDLQPARILHVDGKALLVAIEHPEEARAGTAQRARAVARDRFDLDDLRAEIREQHPAGRAHHHVRHLDHARACVRQRGSRLMVVHCATPVRHPSGCTALGARSSA